MTSFTVAGKTAIVTGAGSGINLSFARLLLDKGCNVVIADLALRPEAQDVVDRHATSAASARAVFVKTDVAIWHDLENMFVVALQEFGDFHIVCPGAGVYEPPWSNFWLPPGCEESKDGSDADRYALLDINLTHPIRTTQLAISHWLYPRLPLPKGGGESKQMAPEAASSTNPKRIVHVTSVAAQIPVFRAPLYGASKYAISGFVRCLSRLDPEKGIRVNAVAPGVVRTPLWTDHAEKLMNVGEEDGWVTPEEVAEAMGRLLEDVDLVGGTILEVGKGYTRSVGWRDDPGPNMESGMGIATSNSHLGDDAVRTWLEDKSIWGHPSS